MRRTVLYAAMTRDERNEADGCFSTACYTIHQYRYLADKRRHV